MVSFIFGLVALSRGPPVTSHESGPGTQPESECARIWSGTLQNRPPGKPRACHPDSRPALPSHWRQPAACQWPRAAGAPGTVAVTEAQAGLPRRLHLTECPGQPGLWPP